jgi:hypothetical protein
MCMTLVCPGHQLVTCPAGGVRGGKAFLVVMMMGYLYSSITEARERILSIMADFRYR